MMDLQSANAAKLEQLIAAAQTELKQTQVMHERLLSERMTVIKEREEQIEAQMKLVATMLRELSSVKEHVDKERLRLVSLMAQFEVAVQSMVKDNEEERRRHREAQSHFETLRQQLEKERRSMIVEVQAERKALEQQHDEFVQGKMQTVGELQGERLALSRERMEWASQKERQVRDDVSLLAKLRERDEELMKKLEALEQDRSTITSEKIETQRLLEEARVERDTLRRERAALEREREGVMQCVEDVRRRANEAEEAHSRLRRDLLEDRAGVVDDRVFHPSAKQQRAGTARGGALIQGGPSSALHLDLARQRAALLKIENDVRHAKEAPY